MERNRLQLLITISMCGCLVWGCGQRMDISPSLNSIDAEGLKKHIALLASDDFQGRAPLTEGEEKTIHYLKQEFENIGLKPGNGNSFFQQVPVVETTIDPKERMIIKGRGKQVKLRFPTEYVATTVQSREKVAIKNSEIVFVGYGIVAPEYDWDDYADVDVRGKTVLILVNDPGLPQRTSHYSRATP